MRNFIGDIYVRISMSDDEEESIEMPKVEEVEGEQEPILELSMHAL